MGQPEHEPLLQEVRRILKRGSPRDQRPGTGQRHGRARRLPLELMAYEERASRCRLGGTRLVGSDAIR
jgi:hypothetical protein